MLSGRLPSALVVLTRPEGRNQWLSQQLSDLQLESLQLPLLGIEPVSNDAASVFLPSDFDLIVFVSGNAVTTYFAQLARQYAVPVPWPRRTLVGVVGGASADAVLRTGTVPSDCLVQPSDAEEQDSESLWKVLRLRCKGIKRALIVRGQDGREWLGQRLEQEGIEVVRHTSYRRCALDWPESMVKPLHDGALSGRRVICLLTSAHSVDSFVGNVQRHGLLHASPAFQYVVIHPRIAGRLQSELGAASGKVDSLAVTICQPDDEAMLQAIQSLAFL